jgi:hypothetical protein
MTQDEVLKELHDVIAGNQQFTTWTVSTPHLVELVNRAVKAEREACAKLCDELSDKHTWVGLTNEELTDLFYNTNLGQQSAVSQAVALLKERNS